MKKRLFANGKFVCEYDAQPTPMEEIHLCHRLLREHGIETPATTEEQAIFRQASSFSTVAAKIYASDLAGPAPRDGMVAVPFVVNAVFALELYLKAVSKLHDTSLRGHDLVDLFDKLPSSATNEIAAQLASAATSSRWKCGIATLDQFRESLSEMRNAFAEWRYLHEKDPEGSSVSIPPLIFAMETLHSVCANHPKITPPV